MFTTCNTSIHGTPAVRAYPLADHDKIAVEFRDISSSSAIAIIDDPHTLAATLTEALEAVDRCYRSGEEVAPSKVSVPIDLLIHLAAPPTSASSDDATFKAIARLRCVLDAETLARVTQHVNPFPAQVA